MPSKTPLNEIDRIIALSEYNLDYSTLAQSFDDLTMLAAKFAGTEVSMVNLLDSYTQWTISKHGIAVDQTPREDSVCQYTIMQEQYFEVKDLSADERFKHMDFVNGEDGLKYYYGVPITTSSGHNLGALCVLDKKEKQISAEKYELLQIIAREVVNRLNTFKQVEGLYQQIHELSDTKRMLAHDIRGPLSGIIGLAELASEEISEKVDTDTEVVEYLHLISESGKSVITLAEDILNAESEKQRSRSTNNNTFNLIQLKNKLFDLFTPRVLNKKLALTIDITDATANYSFSKSRILQILGNLTSNAIKFTPEGGKISIKLTLLINSDAAVLQLKVTDSGTGMTNDQITALMSGNGHATEGTYGEVGYGMGLVLVKQIIDEAKGSLNIESQPGKGSVFSVSLPV